MDQSELLRVLILQSCSFSRCTISLNVGSQTPELGLLQGVHVRIRGRSFWMVRGGRGPPVQFLTEQFLDGAAHTCNE